jgi:H+/gluconate symporter-like permease
MFSQILGLTVVDGSNRVEVGSWPFVIASLPFIATIIAIIVIFWYFLSKKRLEHQQILAAIEKGTPLSELRPLEKTGSDWIRSLTIGIAFLLMGLGIITIMLLTSKPIFSFGDARIGSFLAVIFLAVGIARIIRGILQRKADKNLSSGKSALDADKGL